jgi:hypothetical protein
VYFIGAISGASGGYNNRTTGASGVHAFTIPPNVKSLYLQPQQSGLLFELGAATGISFLTSAARGAQLSGPNVINGPYRCIDGGNVVVSIYWSGAGFCSCKVFGSPTS